MKEVHSIDREIQVVETIINQLCKCLTIYRKSKMHGEFRTTLKDIVTCKQELNRLKKIKLELDAEQGEEIDGAEV